MIDGTALRDKHIPIPSLLQKQILEQLHNNHMGIERTHLVMGESVYWPNMNVSIKQTVKQCPTCPDC